MDWRSVLIISIFGRWNMRVSAKEAAWIWMALYDPGVAPWVNQSVQCCKVLFGSLAALKVTKSQSQGRSRQVSSRGMLVFFLFSTVCIGRFMCRSGRFRVQLKCVLFLSSPEAERCRETVKHTSIQCCPLLLFECWYRDTSQARGKNTHRKEDEKHETVHLLHKKEGVMLRKKIVFFPLSY